MVLFDHTHYVPILRWKQAERLALRNLREDKAMHITPLIELVPELFRTNNTEKNLVKIAHDVIHYWHQSPFFLDLRWIPPTFCSYAGEHLVKAISNQVRAYKQCLIPVTGIHRDPAYQSAVAHAANTHGLGACIRLLREDLTDAKLQVHLDKTLSDLNLRTHEVHMLVDLQIYDPSAPNLATIAKTVPYLDQWRTFTLANGAFPQDLSELEKNCEHELPRRDWLSWLTEVPDASPKIRKPAYSDYTIQYPLYIERKGFQNFSASIRYTYDEYWIIIRGEGVFNEDGPGFKQWPANAQLLVARNEFCGANFSDGDNYIEKMSMQFDKPGNPTTWLQAGINHHLAYVVHQLTSLFDASTVGAP